MYPDKTPTTQPAVPSNPTPRDDQTSRVESSPTSGTSARTGFCVANLSAVIRRGKIDSESHQLHAAGHPGVDSRVSSTHQPTPQASTGPTTASAYAETPASKEIAGFAALPNVSGGTQCTRNDPAIPGFKIIRKIGADGQGEVFLAREESLKRHVALKIPRLDRHFSREMLLAEAHALAKVQHPNVVRIHSIGTAHQVSYFSMELIEGVDLRRFLKKVEDRPLEKLSRKELIDMLHLDESSLADDVRRALNAPRPYDQVVAVWMAHAADGLAAAQGASVLHRDIKPSNLIVASDGRLIVVDFGLARSIDMMPSPHATGVTGTYPYICPERAAGDWVQIDHRADIWSLGATMYELLTGARAYEGHGKEVLIRIATTAPKRPRRLRETIPRELERICMKAMNRAPNDRFHDWAEFSDRLRKWSTARSQMPRGRTRRLVGTFAAVLAICTAASWAAPWMIERVDSRRASRHNSITSIQPEQTHEPSGPGGNYATSNPAGTQLIPTNSSAGAVLATEPEETSRTQPPPVPASDSGESTIDESNARSLPAATSTPDNSTIRKSRSPLFDPPVVMLAFNQDLNTRDGIDAEAGGRAQTECFAKLSKLLGDDHLVSSIVVPQAWGVQDAIDAGHMADATHVLFAELRANVDQTVENLKHIEDTVYVWNVTVSARLIDLANNKAITIPVSALRVTAPANQRIGIDIRHRLSQDGMEVHSSYDTAWLESPGEFPCTRNSVQELAFALAREVSRHLRKSAD